MNIPTLQTSRLKLRPFSKKDTLPLYQLLQGEQVLKYFPQTHPPSLAQVEKMIIRINQAWQRYKFGLWGVERLEEETLLGRCGLQYLPDSEEVEIDFIFGVHFWGQGYATEAGQAALRFGFEAQKIDAIVGIVHLENRASQRVLNKLGMQFTEAKSYFGMACERYEITGANWHRMAQRTTPTST